MHRALFRRGLTTAFAAGSSALALQVTRRTCFTESAESRSVAIGRGESSSVVTDDSTADAVDRKLEVLFRGIPDVHELPANESRLIDESGGHEAYGELTPRGVREVVKRLKPREGGPL